MPYAKIVFRWLAGTVEPRKRTPIFSFLSSTGDGEISSENGKIGRYDVTDSCPAPEFDTGCTHCEPQYPVGSEVKTGAVLAGTAPSVGRHLLVSTGHTSKDLLLCLSEDNSG